MTITNLTLILLAVLALVLLAAAIVSYREFKSRQQSVQSWQPVLVVCWMGGRVENLSK